MKPAVCLSSINDSVFLPAEDILWNWSVIFKMFRRSRFSIRPNVGTAGRTAATPQEAPSSNQESSETPRDVSESSTPAAVTDTTSDVTPSEKTTTAGDGNDQNAEGTSSSAAVQRRKRFSVKPKVAPGRPSTLARTSRSPAKAIAEAPVETPSSDLDKLSTSIQTRTAAAPQGLQSPRRRRRSEESKQPKVQPKLTPDSSEPSAVPLLEDSLVDQPTDSGPQLESKSGSQVKEVPPRPPDKVPFSIPDREAVELSERAKTLVSSKSGISLSPSALSLSRLLNDPSDLQRIAKAKKLRELLRQEKHKEKKLKKGKLHVKEYTIDPTKMTMRDLIYYLPMSNPMISSVEHLGQENETVLPPSPAKEQVQEPEAPPEVPSTMEDEEEMAEEEDDSLMVPRVKVAEDGTLIIDEESLTVEVQRAKGPNPAQGRDPIFERGSTTTYSSFRKSNYTKPWSSEETDMFYLAISMVGTDFSMICQLFPQRTRSEIKNKFKREERESSWRVDKAFRERRKLDIEYFSKLLEKILEVQQNRKKLKSLVKKNSPKKSKRKAKGKKAAKPLSDVEEENDDDADEVPNLEEDEEEEGEKEKENLCNEGGTPVSKPKKQRKRKAKQAAVNEEPKEKKKNTREKSNEEDEACIPEDAEADLPEDQTTSDMTEKTENVNGSKDTAIKPAKLSRGRAPKPLLPLGRKWSKRLPPDPAKAKDTASDKDDESVTDGASKEQVIEDNKRKSEDLVISSEEEDVVARPQRTTRYGRLPKPTKALNYPDKEDAHTSEPNTAPASPVRSSASAAKPKPKCTAKRGRSSKQQSAQQAKKPKLVTLRTTLSDFRDDEEEKQQDQGEIEEGEYPVSSPGEDSAAPVFVPATLRSPRPVISEVEETMEELDILANMPDVLGLSQDALCPDSSFELAQNDTGTAEPCEHQLDLLVDVIDFLSSEHSEVAEDKSYNEAAQTLLTISNLAQLSATQNQIVTQDHTTGTTSVGAEQTEQLLGGADQEDNFDIRIMFDQGDAETSEIIAAVEPQRGVADSGEAPMAETKDQSCGGQKTVSFTNVIPQQESSPEIAKTHSPQARKGRLSKVTPKPNLGRVSRDERPKSTEQKAEDGNTEASDIQVTEPPSVVEETTPKIPDYSPTSSIDDNSSTNTEELRVTQVTGPAAAVISSFDSGSTHTPTIELSTTEEKRTEGGSDQSVSQNQILSEPSNKASTSGSTDEKMATLDGTSETSGNLVTSDPAVTKSQAGQDAAPVQESSDHTAPCVTPVDDVPVSQKEESGDASSCQIRRGRSQKVKPKPNVAQTTRTVRSKSQALKATAERDPSPTKVPEVHEKTIKVEPEATSSTSPEKPSEVTGPAAAVISSFDSGSTHTPTIELSTTEEKRTEGGSDQSVSQNQILSEPSNKASTSGSTDEKMATLDGTSETSGNMVTSDPVVTKSQAGQDAAPVQESSDHTAPCVTPVDDVPVSQKEESGDASSCQIRRGRSQKVKPKPNIAQTTRTARSKPQTREATVERDPSPTQVPKVHGKTIEVEPEATSSTSPEKPSEVTGPAAAVISSFDSGSTHTPTIELSTTEEKRTEGGSDQSVSQNQILSEPSNKASTSGSTDEKMATLDGTSESSVNLVTSDPVVTKSQAGQDAAPVQESSDHTAPCVTPVDDVPVSQKEESGDASSCQIKRGRSQKVKPKPNVAQTTRTVRSKSQALKATAERDPSPTKVPEVHEKIIEVEPEATSSTSPEKPSEVTGPAAAVISSFDSGSTHTPTIKLSTTEEKRTEGGSDQSVSQNQILSEPSNTASTSGSTDENTSNCDAASIQESSDHPAPSATPVDDVPVSQKEERELVSTGQIRRGRAQKIKPKPNLAQTARIARSRPQTTKDPVVHVHPVETSSSPTVKPQSTEKTIAEMEALPICIIALPIQSTDTSTVSVPSLESCSTHKPTEESSATLEQKTEVELNSILESSEPNAPQRRQQFAKVKPSLGSSTRTTRVKLLQTKVSEPSHMDTSSNVTSEPSPVDNSQTEVKVVEEDLKLLTSTQLMLNPQLSITKSAPVESEKTEGTSSDGIVMATSLAAESQSLLKDTVPESESSEMSTFERESTGDKMLSNDSVEAGPASPVSVPIPASDPQSPEGGSTESKISSVLATNLFSISTIHPTESGPQSCPESDTEVKSQDAAQQCSGTRETHQTSSDKSHPASSTQLELTDSSKSTKIVPQSRRGRLINPKPNLGRSSRPQQPQQVQNTARAEADPGAGASVSLSPVSEPRPDIQDPGWRYVESRSDQEPHPNDAQSLLGLTQFIDQRSDSHSNDAVSLLGSVTQTADNSFQNTSTLGTEGTQSHPCLTMIPDLMSEPMPSDPDEPFFILSLSEIPVSSLGQVMDSAAGPLPYLPDGDPPVQQQSVPSLAPEEDASLSRVPVSMSVEERSEMGFLSVKDEGQDSAVHIVSVIENPEDPQEKVQPPTLPETPESNAQTETPLTKKRISGTARRAKVQVKPNTAKKTQARKTVAANTSQDSGLPGPSMQAGASDARTTADEVDATEQTDRCGDHVDTVKDTPAVEKKPEDRSSAALTTETRGPIAGTRKSSDYPSFLSDTNSSDTPRGKAASVGPKVQTRHTRKHSTSTPAASTPPAVAPTPGRTQQPAELSRSTSPTTPPALTTPSTSQCAAEVSAPQQSDCVKSSDTEVEPTSVSQYFLSDIFTDVE